MTNFTILKAGSTNKLLEMVCLAFLALQWLCLAIWTRLLSLLTSPLVVRQSPTEMKKWVLVG